MLSVLIRDCRSPVGLACFRRALRQIVEGRGQPQCACERRLHPDRHFALNGVAVGPHILQARRIPLALLEAALCPCHRGSTGCSSAAELRPSQSRGSRGFGRTQNEHLVKELDP